MPLKAHGTWKAFCKSDQSDCGYNLNLVIYHFDIQALASCIEHLLQQHCYFLRCIPSRSKISHRLETDRRATYTLVAAMGLIIYGDLMSQPTRAIVLFCKLINVEAEFRPVKLREGEHRTPEFKALSPLGKVPVIDDSGFRLQESHAILRYLATTRSCADTWYPADSAARARVDAVLDWHHSNLRMGSAGLVMNRVLAPALGLPLDARKCEEARALLERSLQTIDSVWLHPDRPFLAGFSAPSIADLSLACEIMQLELLGPEERQALLERHKQVQRWLTAVQKLAAPHFEDVHDLLRRAATRAHQRRKTQRVDPASRL
eukprot:jgi/Mesen1/11040/ME000098S10426